MNDFMPSMQLRWRVDKGTSTNPPVLQQFWVRLKFSSTGMDEEDDGEWRDVPRVPCSAGGSHE